MSEPTPLSRRALIVIQVPGGLCYGQTLAASDLELRFQVDQSLPRGTRGDFRLQLAKWGESVVGLLEVQGISSHAPGEAPTYAARVIRMSEHDRRQLVRWLDEQGQPGNTSSASVHTETTTGRRSAIGAAIRESLSKSRRDSSATDGSALGRSQSQHGWHESMAGADDPTPWEDPVPNDGNARPEVDLSRRERLLETMRTFVSHGELPLDRDLPTGLETLVDVLLPGDRRMVLPGSVALDPIRGRVLRVAITPDQRRLLSRLANALATEPPTS